jgi:hypothetical protein
MNKEKFLVCNICNEKLPLNKNWRRDVQAHYNQRHRKDRQGIDKKYISAIEIKEKFFIRSN